MNIVKIIFFILFVGCAQTSVKNGELPISKEEEDQRQSLQ